MSINYLKTFERQREKKTEILLESGTNELEIMEFTVGSELFGINVAKVREIMKASPVKAVQQAHPAIEGIFKPRDAVVTVVDLAAHLGLSGSERPERDIYIIVSLNTLQFAFHVHSVVGISRISWSQIQKPDPILLGGGDSIATGIAQSKDQLITILDFEKIIAEISPQTSIKLTDLDRLGERARNSKPILIAEDSMMLSRLIVSSLKRAGYDEIIITANGQEAWEQLCKIRDSSQEILDTVACVITDIEMPQMDGHHLTKLVKEDPVLSVIPVVHFSSLINEEMYQKGKSVGADEQISKPHIADLIGVLDRLCGLA